jgi:hypothetical protein
VSPPPAGLQVLAGHPADRFAAGEARLSARSEKCGIEMNSLSTLVLSISLVLPVSVASAGSAGAAEPTAANGAAGLAGVSAASDAKAPLALEADGVEFGMSSDQVARLYDRWWDRHFVAKYRKTNPGPKTQELDYQLEEQKKVLRRVAKFDFKATTYDKSEFHDEFAHGNGESMAATKVLRAGADGKAVSYTRRFFFFQDKLWKVYDEYRLEPHGVLGADFKEATDKVAASVGPKAKRTRGPSTPFESVVFDGGPQRVRLVKLAADRVALVRSDNALTKGVLDGRARHAPAPEAGLDPDTQAALR